jgi:hypothetical protein
MSLEMMALYDSILQIPFQKCSLSLLTKESFEKVSEDCKALKKVNRSGIREKGNFCDEIWNKNITQEVVVVCFR